MIVQWLPTALKNLLRITTHLHTQSPQAAHELSALIRAKGAGLSTKYNLYRQGSVAGTHECVAHPNYIIIYRIKPRLGRVEILRVRHAAQKPLAPRKPRSRKT